MKNIIVANFQGSRYPFDRLETEMKAQVENSIAVGWKPEDIMLVTNFQYEFMDVKSINIDLNTFCLTGSKTFAIQKLIEMDLIDGPVWIHDLDLWQTAWFDCPDFKDIGISTYSKPKFNGGSVFYRKEAKDIIDEVVKVIQEKKEQKEEPTINTVFRLEQFKDRITVMNNTYNVGCSGFVERFNRSEKPVKGIHMHPTNRIAYDTHFRDRNRLGSVPTNKRLYDLFMKYFKDKIGNFRYNGERGYDGNYQVPPHILEQFKNG